MVAVLTDECWGTATSAQIRSADRAQARHAKAVSATEDRRAELGDILRVLLDEKGVTRAALADRYDCTSQTIANIAYGRTPRSSRNGSH